MGRTDLHRRRELLQNESSVCLRSLVYFCDSITNKPNQYSVLKHQLDLTQTDASTELHATSNVCKHTPCEHRICVSACIK